VDTAKGRFNSQRRGKTMAVVPVMSEAQWARIIAKAYLEKSTTNFKNTLERDPKAAVDYVRQNNGDLPNIDLPAPGSHLKLMTLDYANWMGGLDSVAKDLLAIFKGSSHQELQDIFNTGKLNGQPVELPPGEWVTDKGLIRLFLHSGPPTISLTDWMRIYAYVWDQFNYPGDKTMRDRFEEDPAQTLLNEIAGPLNLSYKKGDPLFTLGGPDDPPGNLADIKADKGAKQFRHRIRLCC
jgi:hypothetical protein